MKTSRLPLPRFVNPASVDIGDIIRVTWTVGDIEHTRTGKVDQIERRFGWIYYSPEGHEIAHVRRDSGAKVRVTLLAETSVKNEPLFEMDSM